MLTYRLVQPSYAVFKLSSLIGFIRVQVKTSSGELQPKTSACSQLMLRIYQAATVLKLLQLSVSAFKLLCSFEQSSRSLPTAVLVALTTCILTVGLIFSLQFEKYHNDYIVLINPLRERLNDSFSGVLMARDEITDDRKTFFKRRIKKLVLVYRRTMFHLKAVYHDFAHHWPPFSVHEILTIIVPVAISSVFPAAYFCTIIGNPEENFTLSVLSPEFKKIQSLRALTVLFDLVVFSFNAANFHLAFYTLCAVLAIYTPELVNLKEITDWSTTSSRNINYVWKEIRRLGLTFNLFNHLGSNSFYAGKMMAFTCSVLGTFYVFRFEIKDPVSFTIALVAFQAIVFYLLCLGNAFVITETMDAILQNLKLRLQYYARVQKRELKQRIKSVKAVALREGGFRGMSREITPEFIDFYVNEVIALVLTF